MHIIKLCAKISSSENIANRSVCQRKAVYRNLYVMRMMELLVLFSAPVLSLSSRMALAITGLSARREFGDQLIHTSRPCKNWCKNSCLKCTLLVPLFTELKIISGLADPEVCSRHEGLLLIFFF